MPKSHCTTGNRRQKKLQDHGACALSDAELLAVLLHSGYRDSSALALARTLLAEFGGINGLMRADKSAVVLFSGVGPVKYARLQAAIELAGRRTLQQLLVGDVLRNPGDTRRYLQHHLSRCDREVFTCLFVDSQHRVLRCEDLFFGTLDGAAVYPREVAVRALQYRAAAIIFAHNHPSGMAQPSASDRDITQRLRQALMLLDIRVLDHIIVGNGQTYSFAENGLL